MSTKFKVLWVYQQIVNQGHGRTIEGGQMPSLCFKGRTNMYCVSAGHPVRVIKRPAADFDKLREVMHKAGPYPVARAVETFKGVAKRCGITLGAQAIIDRAEAGTDIAEELEESLTNEEETAVTNETPPDAVPGTETETDPSTKQKETTVKKLIKKGAKAPKAAKTKKAKAPKAAKTKAPKVDKGPSRISRAVEYMKAEVKKAGGHAKTDRAFRADLYERAAKKFDLKKVTCGIQYGRQVK